MKRYYAFRDREWKAYACIELDPAADDATLLADLKAIGCPEPPANDADYRLLRPDAGNMVLLEYHGRLVMQLCAA